MNENHSPPSPRSAHWRFPVLAFLVIFSLGLWILYPTPTDGTPQDFGKRPWWTQCNPDQPVKRVAVIGAGSGGTSAAYYVNKFRDPCQRVNITVYERSDYVGGRSTTVDVYGDPTEPVELGASIFVKVNHNLMSAVEEFGLSTQPFGAGKKELETSLGVWDGAFWRWTQEDASYGWWNIARLLWKYGMMPIRTRTMVQNTVGSFLKMYDEPYFPFRDLSQTAYDLGLTGATAMTGEQFLAQNRITPPFTEDIIQASTRVNYAQNLDTIHGLETAVCMATDGAMSVRGGNWQLFDGMLKASGANLLLNTAATSIHKQEDGTFALSSSSTSQTVDSPAPLGPQIYDAIILAAPLQYASLTINPPLPNPPPPIPYVSLHVTLLTSPKRLDRKRFHLGFLSGNVPTTILTTIPKSPPNSNTTLPYYSISLLRQVKNPVTGAVEYLYKIFSPERLERSFVVDILEAPPWTRQGEPFDERDVSWYYEKRWDSYPVERPRVTFEDVMLDENMWYTSAIEGFISTMETSSLMGMNVGRLLVDGWEVQKGKGEKDGDVEERKGDSEL